MKITSLPQPHVISINDSIDGSLRLEEDYHFTIDKLDLMIPKGVIYDGTSVPSWAWSFFKFERRGIHDPASLVHDFLYRYGYLTTIGGSQVFYDRKKSDQLFKASLDHLGIKSWLAKSAYIGVRMFGRSSWKVR